MDNSQEHPVTPGGTPGVLAAYEAALKIAAEMDPDVILQRLVDVARQVVPASYAALGVADDDGRVHTFVTSGISNHDRLAIGDIPEGHGLIGELIRTRQPLMIPNIAEDPRSVGFPPHHPPMKALLGVPILLGDRAVGNLYLAEPIDQDEFTRANLEALTILAIRAAQAIDRAQLFAAAKANQRQAEEQRDQLEVILNSIGSAVFIQNSRDGHVELVNTNARALLVDDKEPGLFRQPQEGRDYHILKANGDTLPRDQWPASRAWQGEMVRNAACTFVGPKGRRVPILAQAAPLRDSYGVIARVVLVFADVTRLREAEQLKDDFLSLVSHELRTPLTAIHGGAHVLAARDTSLDENTRREILSDIVHESDRLDRTLSNVLTLTAIEAGQIEPEIQPMVLPLIVGKSIDEISAQTTDYTFTRDLPKCLPPADGNPELFGHVLRSLYENAMKYSPPGTTIHTEIRKENTWISVCITDQGVGIASEHVPHVFERFRRPGADPAIRGMGLGLYLSQHLMSAQRGTLSAKSPGVGEGSTFTIRLPEAPD